MNQTLSAVTKLLDELDWKYQLDPRDPVIHTGVQGRNGHWRCVATTGREGEHLLFLSLFPSTVPEPRRQACAELLTRINYNLAAGCFEMDFDEGEIRYRTTLPAGEGNVDPEALKWVIVTNLASVDAHFGAIMRVIHAGCTPKEAIEESVLLESKDPRFELN